MATKRVRPGRIAWEGGIAYMVVSVGAMALRLPRVCIVCGTVSRNGNRCPAHAMTNARGYGGAWRKIRQAMIEAEPWCHYPACTHAITPTNPLTLDHYLPKQQGGTDDPSNLWVICKWHNTSKGMSTT